MEWCRDSYYSRYTVIMPSVEIVFTLDSQISFIQSLKEKGQILEKLCLAF